MNYIDIQDKNIKKICINSRGWYKSDSGIWGERYMRETKDILTKKRTKKEIDIILKYLPIKCKKILDAPCGYGRISNILAIHGYSVTGIDINKYFIDIAKKEATKKGLKVTYIISDIIRKKLSGGFDAVLNIFTSIGYFESDKKNELFIKNLCQYVKPGGRLIIETINPIALLANYNNKEKVKLKDGSTLYFERLFDVRSSTNTTRIQKNPKRNIRKDLCHIIRLYYPHELINICEKYNCRLLTILNQNGQQENIINSLRIWLIFNKK